MTSPSLKRTSKHLELKMNRLSISHISVFLNLALALSACGSSTQEPGTPPSTGGGTMTSTGGSTSTGTGGDDAGTGGSPGSSAESLAAKYADYFPVGVAIAQSHLSTVKEIVQTEFNHITAENAMKAQTIQPAEGTFNYTEADLLAEFARDEGMKMTGHTLLWHRQAPAWFFAGLTPGDTEDIETLKLRLKTHIDAVVPRYADVVDNWDVVNEAVSDDGSKDPPYRDGAEGSKWFDIFGNEDFVYWAFKYAKDALEAVEPGSSEGKLYYNDYNVTLKVDAIIALCDGVRAKGGQVDGIGLQAHYRVDWPSDSDIESTINKIVAAGYKVKISELDLSLYNDYPSGTLEPAPEVEFTTEVEQLQADRYGALFALFRKHKDSITSVTLWGVSDDSTWLDNEPVANRNNYPLLFNDAHMPKLAVQAIKNF
jgi:endo-1,4-beta-xylanase